MLSTCSKLSTSYQDCESDFECAAYTYCWFAQASSKPDKKQCLPMYSQSELDEVAWEGSDHGNPTLEEYRKNGLYCKSGLAFPVKDLPDHGKCAIIDHVEFNGQTIEYPYQCDPKDNAIKCQMWFNITEPEGSVKAEQSYYETECRCALDGDKGFCGQILGTEHYKEEISKISSLLQQSNCHTNDRENYAALRD